jgi:Asp-tRNA(Asn)/Glu-tRNA(Gln) amidotransferase A subunit family amidase
VSREVTIDRIRGELKAGHITCRDLIRHCLKRIDAYDHAGPALNAFQTVNRRALDEPTGSTRCTVRAAALV